MQTTIPDRVRRPDYIRRYFNRHPLFTPRRLRLATQTLFLLFIARLIAGHVEDAPAGVTSLPSPEAYCPLGGFETLGYWLKTGGIFIQHSHLSNLVLFAAIVLSAIIFKGAFCGWVCPFGTIQEWLAAAGRRLGLFGLAGKLRFLSVADRGKSRRALPRWVPGWVRRPTWIRYVVLAWVIIGASVYTKLVFRDWDPYAALLQIKTPALTGGMVALVITIIASLFTERPWCKYLCPLGAFNGLVGRLAPLKVRRHAEFCTDCGRCTKACPMNIKVQTARRVGDPQCISCLSCVESCPAPKALGVGPLVAGGRRGSRLASYALVGVLSVALVVGTVKAAQAVGFWQTSGKLDAKGNAIVATGKDPSEIRGWMTMSEVLKAYNLTKDEVYAAFSIPTTVTEATALKDIESLAPAFSPANLRDWITKKR